MHLLWPISLGVILALYMVMRQLEQSAKLGMDTRYADNVIFAISVGFASSAFIWTVAGWLLHWPFGWLDQQGWPGQLALAVMGGLTGLAVMPAAALGFLVAYTILTPAPALVIWLVFPAAIGCTVHWLTNLRRHRAWSEYAFDRRVRSGLLAEFVHHVTGPSVQDRTVHMAARVAYIVPVALAADPGLFSSAAKPGWLGLCGAALLSANLWIWDWYLHVILRRFRAVFRITAALSMIAAACLAISPVGTVIARALAQVPIGWIAAIAVGPPIQWLITAPLRKHSRPLRGLRLVANSAVDPVAKFIAVAIVPIYLVVLEHPHANLLAAATGILAVLTTLDILGAPVLTLVIQLFVEVRSLPRMGPVFCQQIVGHWAFDQFVATRGPGDYRFVRALGVQYARTGQPELLGLARTALRVIEQDILPLTAGEPRAALKAVHDQLTAECDALAGE